MSDTHPSLGGVWNFRDVAWGVRDLRAGCMWRASQLSSLDAHGQIQLVEWGVDDVVDVRTVEEKSHHGHDQLAPSIRLHELPFESDMGHHASGDLMALLQEVSGEFISMQQVAYQHMLDEYARFPLLEGAQQGIRCVIDMLSQGQGVMVHCLAGKDRTGFMIAMILEALECDLDTIMSEYLYSNYAIEVLREKILHFLSFSPVGSWEKLGEFVQSSYSDVLWGVREEYLLAAYHVINTHFGSVQQYFHHIQLSDEQRICLGQQLWGEH